MNETYIRELSKCLRQLERRMSWQFRFDGQCCGVTLSQCHVLLELGKRKNMSIVELSKVLGFDPSTLSRTIDGLVNGGYAAREINPDDRRYISVSLTGKGREVRERIEKASSAFLAGIVKTIPDQEQPEILESFRRFLAAVDESVRTGSCCPEGKNESER
jgi:DNA-binding MarR family transcriptional regulator